MPRKPHVVGERPRYRRISTCLWGDEKFRLLSAPKPNAQSLWLFLLCGPQTRAVPGLFSAGEAALAEMLAWSVVGFRKAWRELDQAEMVKADWAARLVWIPKALRHNPPESPNVVRSWRATVDEMPECSLKTEAVATLRSDTEAFGEAFGEAFRQAFGEGRATPSVHPSGNQEQEQDQEQEQEHDRGKAFPEDPHAVRLERFETFWKKYPRQEQCEPARMLWCEIAINEGVSAQIMRSLEAHRRAKAWQDAMAKREQQFIPLAKNWLRERLWLDMPSPEPTTAGPVPDASRTDRYLADLRSEAAPVEAAS